MLAEFWSPQQKDAIGAVARWQRSGDPLFKLFGYAGVGKTTLIRFFGELVDGKVAYASFTGKAASVMRRKGCDGASTIHRLIYMPPPRFSERVKHIQARMTELRSGGHVGDGEYRELESELGRAMTVRSWVLRSELEPRPRLIIIDEVSMVNAALARDLMSFGIPLLVVGDPAQLPPVRGSGYFMEGRPDVLLTEIFRQAAGSIPLRMATQVRGHGARSLPLDGLFHLRRRDVDRDALRALALGADQVLVGLHCNRMLFNAAMRRAAGFAGPMPMPGEKLVCRRNNANDGLLNGTLWRVLECHEDYEDEFDQVVYRATIADWDDASVVLNDIVFDPTVFSSDDKSLIEIVPRDINVLQSGYALTVHSAQGSEWPRVLVLDDWRLQSRTPWLYTGLTRGSEQVRVVRDF